ncbi:MAG: DUF3500 domain-containing protein [Porticoccaceae bacterium]
MLRKSRNFFLAIFFSLLVAIGGAVFAHDHENVQKKPTESMAVTAGDLLESLPGYLRNRTNYDLYDEERFRWAFIPDEMYPRNGLPLREMNAEQQKYTRNLLKAGLSQYGYLTASALIELERVLKLLEVDNRWRRDPGHYRVTIFGDPAADGTWAWRFEGHHLSLHFQIVEGELTVSTPSFFGSNPAHVTQGAQTPAQEGQRVLADREDTARSLVTSLSGDQLNKALLSDTAPGDIVTGSKFPIDPLEATGIRADQLNEAQRMLLRQLVSVYTSAMADEIAVKRWEKIERDGFESVTFAWAGQLELGEPHYYRVQGPSFLIEYDNVQNDANHIHSVWRDFDGDFGEDLLRQHHAHFPHDK